MDVQLAGILWLMVLLFLGLLNCYFGYRLFIITVGIVGLILAGALGYLIGDWLGNPMIALILTIVLGLIGAWASVTAYYAFIFVVGAFGFAFLATFLAGLFQENPSFLFPLIGGLIGGVLALWLQRVIIIIATASQGAVSAILAGTAIITGGGMEAYRRLLNSLLDGELSRTGGIWFYLGVLVWLILFASGLGTQFVRGKEMYRHSRTHEE
jgi:hypothetical protein